MDRRRETWLFLVVGAVLCALTFGSQLGGSFVWDDVPMVRDNPSLQSWHGLVQNFTLDSWQAAGHPEGQFYRPLLLLTFWVQAQLGATTVPPYRLLNIALHLGAAFLFLRVLRRFAISPRLALATAWLFVVHPVVIEPVMFLGGRQEPLGVLYSLGAMLLWPAPQATRRHARRWLATLLVLCAFLTKEAYLIAPLLIALSHLVWHGAGLTRRALLREAAWLLMPCAAVALGFALRARLGVDSSSPIMAESLAEQLKIGASLFAHYGGLIGTLSNGTTYALYKQLSGLLALLVLAPCVALGLTLLVAWWRSKRANVTLGGAWLGMVWFAATLAPLVLIVPILSVYQNRYAYFPLLGALLGLASLAELARPRVTIALDKLRAGRALIIAAALGVLALTMANTRLEASAWSNNLTLFQTDALNEPTNGIALYHYGVAIGTAAGCSKALPFYRDAARYAPMYPRAWGNLAGCLIDLGQYAEGVEPARHALALDPDNAGAHYNMGVLWLRTGHRKQGLTELQRALALEPGHRKARTVLDYLSTHATLPDE